jgi:Ca2+:H+ antiporter
MSNNPSNDGNDIVEPSEHIRLLGDSRDQARHVFTNSRASYYKHKNRAIRWSALVVYTAGEVLKTNYVNALLVSVPLGIIAGASRWSAVAQFALDFVAIIPLASLLAFATEELAGPLGQTLGGLLNATFGNAVELIVSTGITVREWSDTLR